MIKKQINSAIEYLDGCRLYSVSEANIPAVDLAIEALKKQLPKEPIAYSADMKKGLCICGKSVHINQSFCEGCGQHLEWGEIHNKKILNNFDRIKKMDIDQMASLFVNELDADTDSLDPNLCKICEKENGCRLDEDDFCYHTKEQIVKYWLMAESKEGDRDE